MATPAATITMTMREADRLETIQSLWTGWRASAKPRSGWA